MKRPSKDLTHGSLWKNIFIFSIPLMLSNILQVLKIPSEFIQMLPYLATIAGLTVYSIQKSAAASRKIKKLKEVQG